MGFEFNKDAAQKAGRNNIDTSAIYKGEFTIATEKIMVSGAECINFNFKSDSGQTANYMSIYTKKRGGDASYGANMIMALMGILQIRKAETIDHDGSDNYDCFCGKKIALAIQRVETPESKYPFKLEILHFFDYHTLQTYSEKSNNLNALTHLRNIEDKFEKRTGTSTNNQDQSDDDLPF